MTLMADLIEQLEPYVQEIKVSNKEVSWEDALQDLKMLTPLSEIGTEVLASLNQSSEGRKQRKKS